MDFLGFTLKRFVWKTKVCDHQVENQSLANLALPAHSLTRRPMASSSLEWGVPPHPAKLW